MGVGEEVEEVQAGGEVVEVWVGVEDMGREVMVVSEVWVGEVVEVGEVVRAEVED